MKNFLPLGYVLAFLGLASCGPAHQADDSQRSHEQTMPSIPATTPVSRDRDPWWLPLHEQFNARAKQGSLEGDIDLIFVGDSITHQWSDAGKDVWDELYGKRHAVNFGIGGDWTQHVLWRLEHGNLDGLATPAKGIAPKLVVVMIGTNNSGDDSPEAIAQGIRAIVAKIREKLPKTKVLLLAIFPRGEHPDRTRDGVARASELARAVAEGKMVHYLDIGPTFLEPDGSIRKEIMPDFLHLSKEGYQRWASAIEPKVRELMGEGAK